MNDDSTIVYLTLAVIGTSVAGNQALKPHWQHQEVFHPWDARAAGSVARESHLLLSTKNPSAGTPG